MVASPNVDSKQPAGFEWASWGELQRVAMCFNASLVQVPAIQNPWARNLGFHRFRNTYNKLNVFRAPVQRIVFLDADTLVIRNIDDLFRTEGALAAVPDGGRGCSDVSTDPSLLKNCRLHYTRANIFNSGVMAATPSSRLFSDMLAMVWKVQRSEKAQRVVGDRSDQGFLNTYFNRTYTPLDKGFNTFAYEERTMPGEFDLSKVKVLHYSGSSKHFDPACPLSTRKFAEAITLFHQSCFVSHSHSHLSHNSDLSHSSRSSHSSRA